MGGKVVVEWSKWMMFVIQITRAWSAGIASRVHGAGIMLY